jgi:hypothetical protein
VTLHPDPPRHRQFTCQRNRGIGVVNFPVLRIFNRLVIIRRTCGHAAKPGRRSPELMLARAAALKITGWPQRRWRRRAGPAMRYADTRPERITGPGDGRLAQRESASFTPRRSLVRSQYRPRAGLRWSVARRPPSTVGRGAFPGAPGPRDPTPARADRWPLATFRAGRSAFPGPRPRQPGTNAGRLPGVAHRATAVPVQARDPGPGKRPSSRCACRARRPQACSGQPGRM